MNTQKNTKDFESELNVNSEFFGLFREELINLCDSDNSKESLKSKLKKPSDKPIKQHKIKKLSSKEDRFVNKSRIESTSKTLNFNLQQNNLDNTKNSDIEDYLENLKLSDYEIKKIKSIIKYFVNK